MSGTSLVLLAMSVASAAGLQMPAFITPGLTRVCPATVDSAETTYSYVLSVVPTIDGRMDPGEWDDACATPMVGGRVTMLLKQDGDFWYIACRMRTDRPREPGAQWGLAIDEDNDGEWEPDRSEGMDYIWVNQANADEVLYRWHTPDTFGQPLVLPGAASASGRQDSFLVFEAALPIGRLPYQLTLNDPHNDTIGFYSYAVVGSDFLGWWPNIPEDSWNNPACYGKVIFCPQPVPGVEDYVPAVGLGGLSLPTVMQPGVLQARQLLLPGSEASVCDAAGRHILSSSFPLDLRRLSSGVYYIRLDAGRAVRTARFVLQR